MKQLFKLTFGLILFSVTIFAQEIDFSAPIPFDASVKTGKLKNGLTYYIKKNSKPENKVTLRLVVNAGSILENDDQQGLAHFMEHMCFNGTKRFPKNKLVDYLQSIGVKFGQHLNAYTSFDETVYFLPIPSDSPDKIENGFNIIEDWAFNANLTPEEIDKERGVVLEEYRIGLGAGTRMLNKYLPKMMHNSKYAERLPIGKKEILENFKYEKVVSFYKDWYRPNLMSVIVVGDIDVAEMEKKIFAHFENYKNPANEKPRIIYDVPNHEATFVAIETDKEATASEVQLMYKDYGAPKLVVNVGDYKISTAERLFTSMLNTRLRELVNSTKPPFTYGYSYYGGTFCRNKNAFQSVGMSQEGGQLSSLKALVTENERVKKFGFTQAELDRSKESLLSSIEKAFNERDKTNSESFVGAFQAHYLEKEIVPGIDWKYATTQQILPTIKLEYINGLIKDYLKEDNRVVILTSPEKEDLKQVSEQEVIAALKIDTDSIENYKDEAVAKSLIRTVIKSGTIVKRKNNAKIGTKTLFLSNGAKVTYKKTDFKNDEILFGAVSLGGTNLYSDIDMKKVQFANGALTEAGFSGLKLNDINKFMTGIKASVRPNIDNGTEGFSGNAAPKDLEYLFQMTYAYFTDLNQDTAVFEAYKQKQSAYYKNMAAQPDFYFQQELVAYLNQKNPRFNGIIPTEKTWTETDYNLAYNKYKERFANAGDFEFYFVGNIDEQKIEEFAIKYLAGLPNTGKKEKTVDLGYRMIPGNLKKIVTKGTDPKSNVAIIFYGDAKYSDKEAISMQALGEILTIKLVEQLRENESGVYNAAAHGGMNKVPYGSYDFFISFPCGPENAEKLTTSALIELQKIIDYGPDLNDLNKFKEGELQEYKEEIKKNGFWLNALITSYTNDEDIAKSLKIEKKVNDVNAKDIQNVARKYLSKDKVIGILMPETK